MIRTSAGSVAMVAILATGIVAGATCARAIAPDSSLVTLFGPPDAFVALNNGAVISGTLPLTLRDAAAGSRYRLSMGGPGYEPRMANLDIDETGRPAVRGMRLSIAGQNTIFPGAGSLRVGRKALGVSEDLCIAGSLVSLGLQARHYRNARNHLDYLEQELANATSYAEAAWYQEAAHVASRKLNAENDHRRRLAILSAALYAWQIIDPLLTAPPPGSRAGAARGELTLEASGDSRVKAMILSLVHPGRGQFYQGKAKRGIFFSMAACTAGLVALEWQNRYDLASVDYEVCVERFNAADAAGERNQLRSEAARLWDTVEENKDRRDISLIVLAGIWGYGLIDAAFPADREGPRSRLSLDADARGASMVIRF